MGKIADKYFKTDSWKVIEDGFDKSYSQVAESIFSLGNEYMGVRGYQEEGYSGDTLVGSYFNGVYEAEKLEGSSYKGIVDQTEFMVNCVDWLYTRISIEGEYLDTNKSNIRNFQRVLDMKTGVLTRSFVWITQTGKEVEITFERFLSMVNAHIGVQKITVKALNFAGTLKMDAGMDYSIIHQSRQKNFWDCEKVAQEKDFLSMHGSTLSTKQQVFTGMHLIPSANQVTVVQNEMEDSKILTNTFAYELQQEETVSLTKIVDNVVYRDKTDGEEVEFQKECDAVEADCKALSYDALYEENADWWSQVWKSSDIQIDGDEENQQGIRFCIFQMFQTYHGARMGNNIGAKGLTGEAYNGNAFWDTETYCLPFFLFNNLQAAKNLLLYRYVTLPEAKRRAMALDCEGAFYPIATISGRECCNLWQHASLQLQASTAVAYGIWIYEKITGDETFVFERGIEMLVEVCRMLATRGSWSADQSKYGYYSVMGPDEFQMMINHNCYTNYMAKFTFEYTLSSLEKLKSTKVDEYEKVKDTLHISEKELTDWDSMQEHMYIPKDEKTGIYEQHDGFFELPHVDIDAIPIADFPLYDHWSYDRIYRNDMIKQPDVLMFMLLFNHGFSEEELKANYEFYEPKCIHESSLSPSVHSILASQLKKHEEAYDFFQFATRMDLDNYNRNTAQGLHTTSIAAAWLNIVYGFGGLRSDGEHLELNPSIPKEWEGYSFHITYQQQVISIAVEKEKVRLAT
ncbi:glycoside hydrolase family 65 protein, partial [Anaerosporobacter sp.]|uniref:glycoside hydrolase family 65 protein n=1 Tax=Anaerosporobacter sp. TaxID=1872529 RepID=UPI00286FAB2D